MSVLDDVELTLVTTLEDVFALQRWLGERRSVNALGCDTETTGLNPMKDKVRLLQIGDDRHGWAIDREKWLGLFEDVIRRWEGDWIFHNGPFDTLSVEQSCGIDIPRHKIHDTMVQSRINESNMSMALKSQAARHVDPAAAGLQEVLKGTNFTWATVPVGYQPYWCYGALDPVLTYCLDRYHRPLVEAEAPKAYELEMATLWIAENMGRNGTHVDRRWVADHYEKFTSYCNQVEQWVATHYNIKPGSNAAIVQILSEAGYSFSKATKSGAVSLDAEVLAGIDHPLAQAVLGRRQAQKMASTYFKFYLNETTDTHSLVHPSFNTLGARTSRMSCNSPNLQNVPRIGTSKFADAARNSITSRYIPPELLLKFDADGFTHQDALNYGALLLCDFAQIEMRILTHLTDDENMIAAFKSPDDFFVTLARAIYHDNTINKKDPRRRVTKNAGYACVPLNSEIFTQRGWLTHDNVKIGDMTIGYNFESGCSEWTPITEVVHYSNADLVSVRNDDREFSTTPNHRWVCESTQQSPEQRFVISDDLPESDQRILLAAPVNVNSRLNITDHEAEILGWMFGTSNTYRSTFTDIFLQKCGSSELTASITIAECEPQIIAYVDDLLNKIPHKRYVSKRLSNDETQCITWKLQSTWYRSLLQRSDLCHSNIGPRILQKPVLDLWQFACQLSFNHREAMIRGIHGAKDSVNEFGTTDNFTNMHQVDDKYIIELIIALGYLNGKFVKVYHKPLDQTSNTSNEQYIDISHQHATITEHSTVVNAIDNTDVWCVQTGLGSWTMRQDGITPVLTGNTIYGAGVRKFAATAGVSEAEAREFFRRWNTLYPGVPRWQQSIIHEATSSKIATGQAFVRSPLTNRRYVGDSGKEYALANYCIQGAAAEINKMKLIELDNAGLGPWMIASVHDEVILDVPGTHVLDVVAILEKIMNDDTLLSVPIRSEIAFGHRWGLKKDWTK